MKSLLVVKLGGSSASSPFFARWIEAIEASAAPVMIVPGGGPFANAVRRYQPRMGYDAAAAQHMMVLAMEQFGFALTSLGHRMVAVGDDARREEALASGHIPVWLPSPSVVNEPGLREHPDLNSDSIAALVAGRIAGAKLLLVKQIDVPARASAATLVHAEIVDPAFGAVLQPQTRLYLAGPADLATAKRRFAEKGVPGRELSHSGDVLHAAE